MKLIEVNRERLNGFRLEAQGLSPRLWDLNEVFDSAGWLPSRESAYLAAEARAEGFTRKALDQALFEDRTLIELATVRGQSMVLPREMAAAALRCPFPSRRAEAEDAMKRAGVPKAGHRMLFDTVLFTLADGPQEFSALLEGMRFQKGAAEKFLSRPEVLNAVLAILRLDGRIARTKTEAPLGGGAGNFVLTENLLDGQDISELSPRDALRILCAWYFRVHGPATKTDFGWWTGAGSADVADTFAAHEPNLVAIRIAGLPFSYYMPPSRLETLRHYERSGAEPILLTPFQDPWLSSHEGRMEQFVRQEEFLQIPPGPAVPLILVSGMVAGRWEYDIRAGRVDLRWFRKPVEGIAERAERRGMEIASFLQRELPDLKPLTIRGQEGDVPVYV